MSDSSESEALAREMARSTAALFGAASLVTVLGLLLPHAREVDSGGLVVVAALAGTVAALLAWGRDRVPLRLYPAIAVLGTLTVSLGLFFNGERNGGPVGSDEMFYLWVALWAAYYFRRRVLAVQVALVLAAFGATLALIHPGPAGTSRWISVSGLVIGAAVVVRMLSERNERLVGELRRAALTDPLTGLPNRRALESAFVREAGREGRAGRPFSLLLLDLDRFKQLNDEHGHKAGDRALIEIGELLRRHARPADTAARIGGDEFALLLSETRKAEAAGVRLRLAQAIQKHALVAEWPAAASIGLSSSEDDGASMDELMRHADMRLYALKRETHARLPAYPLRAAG
jgi:diguanylate cyclase (GGDEF)-like protein